jgi:hypothetical protein
VDQRDLTYPDRRRPVAPNALPRPYAVRALRSLRVEFDGEDVLGCDRETIAHFGAERAGSGGAQGGVVEQRARRMRNLRCDDVSTFAASTVDAGTFGCAHAGVAVGATVGPGVGVAAAARRPLLRLHARGAPRPLNAPRCYCHTKSVAYSFAHATDPFDLLSKCIESREGIFCAQGRPISKGGERSDRIRQTRPRFRRDYRLANNTHYRRHSIPNIPEKKRNMDHKQRQRRQVFFQRI